ncbi:hypothetical protein RB614_22705 [Phytohabitans sp. ZYX-F-186]|uniref:Uncharacterized protein n=1 Tax=Phytohabitans maris TaxID=3071409 RepID=A0ABU0ZJW8_9ACTN|nr:hypothetical protein [Phytohabitans sp. ZYX-F-186]MDQ7907330.1 hypothetical protein [Phytohabitans sp. ZYX-F-186]
MRIEGPDGRRWWVGRRWLPWRWRPRGADVGGGVPDFPVSGDEPIGFLIAIGVLAVIVVLPAILVAAVFVAEWLLLLLLLPIVTVLRVGFGMPWTVVARAKGARYTEQVSGWRRSRELIRTTRSEIKEYGEPRSLFSVST